MTNEELENVMNFIIERQERTVEQQAEHDERIARFERSYTVIADLLQRHDSQIVTLTDNANNVNEAVAGLAMNLAELNASVSRLSTTVERYIKARGNGSNGQPGGQG